jgi:hypothetical protein
MAATHQSHLWSKSPYVIRKEFDGTTSALAVGALTFVTLPAKTVILDGRVEVTTAGTGTGTVALGVSANLVAAAVVTSTGYMTATGTKVAYATETAIPVTIATATVNAKFVVTLVVADIS